MPTAKRGRASIDIAAPPDRVYDLVTDVTRMGEWSPECYRCIWLDGADAASVGARFRGYNRLGRFRWRTTAEITRADRGQEFAFTIIDDKTGREETAWRYQLQETPTGTTLTESYEFRWCPLANRIIELPIRRGHQVNRGIEQTLRAIKITAEAEQ